MTASLSSGRQMKLSVFLSADPHYHLAGWRHPDAYSAISHSLADWVDLATTLERAKLDMMFVADTITPVGAADPDTFTRAARFSGFEPLTLLSALSAVTSQIGLAATINTTYNAPFHVARRLASLDHLSGGRAGWNVVTGGTAEDAANFNRDEHMKHEDRYAWAEEFVDVVTGLWDTFADDAFVRDKATGLYLDPTKYRLLNHKSAHFQVRGPLGIARPPQGHPIIIQAGSSDPAKQMAARVADISFTAHPDIAPAKAFYADVKARAAAFGRHPDAIKVMPGASIFVGRSEAEAEEKFQALQELIPDIVAVRQLSGYLGVDLSGYPLDQPLPDLKANAVRASGPPQMSAMSRAGNISLVEMARRAAAGRNHLIVKGTPKRIADELETWFHEGAADGFNLLPSHLPNAARDIADSIVPELQRRGLFRTEYEGNTLRDRIGVSRPADAFGGRTKAMADA